MVRKISTDKIFDWIINILMGAIAIMFLLPLVHVVVCSFSSVNQVIAGNVGLFPVDFTIDGYKEVFARLADSKHPYATYRQKFGKGNYVIAIDFKTTNNMKDYKLLTGYQFVNLFFDEDEDIYIIDSFDTDESDNTDRDDKVYVMINARSGVWCRKGAGFKCKKYKAIPYGTKCELLVKNVSKISGYYWDKIIYNGEEVFVPNNWNKYL